MLFEMGEDEYETRHLIYTEDLDVLLDFICFDRGLEKDSAELKVGMDSGQKRMLVTLHIDGKV